MTGEGRHRAFTDDARDASPENLRPSFAWSACFLDGGAGVRGEAGGEALQASTGPAFGQGVTAFGAPRAYSARLPFPRRDASRPATSTVSARYPPSSEHTPTHGGATVPLADAAYIDALGAADRPHTQNPRSGARPPDGAGAAGEPSRAVVHQPDSPDTSLSYPLHSSGSPEPIASPRNIIEPAGATEIGESLRPSGLLNSRARIVCSKSSDYNKRKNDFERMSLLHAPIDLHTRDLRSSALPPDSADAAGEPSRLPFSTKHPCIPRTPPDWYTIPVSTPQTTPCATASGILVCRRSRKWTHSPPDLPPTPPPRTWFVVDTDPHPLPSGAALPTQARRLLLKVRTLRGHTH
ncbi:hypothetical protein FOMPIDRAFT_1055933 [Fomitopsis schrenkii]|uniref:Uncharacterized protein n=1 Tax=Fomitopsis schrenkii TaxID=2126942 RepID=S8DIR0_FOMSC|nr:hypothetical protein FOMPIDRAFT_1055933 [Fomitopsis schrenkii]